MILSRKFDFPVVIQHYDVDVNKEYIIRGNAGILKCQTPSFVADYLSVISWQTDSNETFGAMDMNYGRRPAASWFPAIPHLYDLVRMPKSFISLIPMLLSQHQSRINTTRQKSCRNT